jgi:hypothetical protein
MTYVEERQFILRLELRCTFPDDYEGDEDGYEWAKHVQPIVEEVVAAAAAAFKRRPGWHLHPANRGRPSSDEVTLVAELLPK